MQRLKIVGRVIGIDGRAILALRYLFRYFSNMVAWWKLGGKVDIINPILYDYADRAGTAKGHYFHQDLLVAQKIYQAKPKKHIDIGSRIDGFVAHVAAFREIFVIDVRPMDSIHHSNIKFIQQDMMNPTELGVCDSISCLHAIEHFGLGRYGDPINVNGHFEGIKNISRLLTKGGKLYLSFPVSRHDRLEFNAHRVLNPSDFIINSCLSEEFVLDCFDLVDDSGELHENFNIQDLGQVYYGCGILTMTKIC